MRIEAAIAGALASAGAHVTIHGQSEASTAKTRARIETDGGQCDALFGDLADQGTAKGLIEACERQHGKLDILVINASLAELISADLTHQIDVNLRATIDMLQTCLPLMEAPGLVPDRQHRVDQSVGPKASGNGLCSNQGGTAQTHSEPDSCINALPSSVWW